MELIGRTLATNDGTNYRVGERLAKGTFCNVFDCAPLQVTGSSTSASASSKGSTVIIKAFNTERQFRRTILALDAIDEYCEEDRTTRARAREHIENIVGMGAFTAFLRESHKFSALSYVIMPKFEIRLKDFLVDHVAKYNTGFPALATLTVAKQLFLALDCLEHAGVVHGDIKPGNIMFRTMPIFDEASVSSFNIVLCDFGSARLIDEKTEKCPPASVGTTSFIAPEILLGLPYTSAADIWSAMATIFTVITGDTLFDVFGEDGLDYGVDMKSIYVAEEIDDSDESSDHDHDHDHETSDHDHDHEIMEHKASHADTPAASSASSLRIRESSTSSSSDARGVTDDIDYPMMFAHVVLMYRLLGKPPEAFCDMAPDLYYNGVPRYTPTITSSTISQLLLTNYTNLNRMQIQHIEEFLMLGLQYLEADRSNANAILAHRFLSPVTQEPVEAPRASQVRSSKKRKSGV